MSKFGRKSKQPPPGYEYIESTLTALDNELREKVNEPHEGLRKTESQWPVHQINWQRSRYIYDMYYTYEKISRELYDYCIECKIVDAGLIAKWKKPGYERLCSTYVINPRNYKFGTVSICRVPKHCLAVGTEIEDPMTGCRGCASGPGGERNIFGNKYGQYLARIQIAREEHALHQSDQPHNSDDGNDSPNDDADAPVCAADGSSEKKGPSIWQSEECEQQEEEEELPEELLGRLAPDAEREGRQAAQSVTSTGTRPRNDDEDHTGKKMKKGR